MTQKEKTRVRISVTGLWHTTANPIQRLPYEQPQLKRWDWTLIDEGRKFCPKLKVLLFCSKREERLLRRWRERSDLFRSSRRSARPCSRPSLSLTHEQEYLTGLLLRHLSLPLSSWMNWREKRKPFFSLCPPFSSLSLSLALPLSPFLNHSLSVKAWTWKLSCKAVFVARLSGCRSKLPTFRPSYFLPVWCGPHPQLQLLLLLLLLLLQLRRRPPRSGPTPFWPCWALPVSVCSQRERWNRKSRSSKWKISFFIFWFEIEFQVLFSWFFLPSPQSFGNVLDDGPGESGVVLLVEVDQQFLVSLAFIHPVAAAQPPSPVLNGVWLTSLKKLYLLFYINVFTNTSLLRYC